jgi:hypothetical protein
VRFDWFKRGRQERQDGGPLAWRVYLDAGDVVAEDGRGGVRRAPLGFVRSVRVVPLTAGNHHVQSSGWQVTLARSDGDVLLGNPLSDWQAARELARLVCQQTELPLDELTQRMFSRVGQYTPSSGSA